MAKDTITVFDAQGRAREIPRAEFAAQVLPKWLEAAWNDANTLAQQVTFALNEGLHAHVLDAARQLDHLDAGAERGRILLAATQGQNGQLDEAEATLRACIAAHGESAISVVNLARVLAARGEQAQAEQSLARALALDPNNENALGWTCQLEQQKSGEPAAVALLERLAAPATSWRAKTWLGSQRMRTNRTDEAIVLFRAALPAAASDAGALLAITGELGKSGKLAEMVELCFPHYDARRHRPETGFNLCQALLQLGRKADAAAVLEQLRALNLPPLKTTIEQFAARLGQATGTVAAPAAQTATAPAEPRRVEIRLLNLEGPVWTQALAGARWLAPEKSDDAPLVSVFTFADEAASDQKTLSQIDDVRRRLSRSLALYLAESVHLRTRAKAECIVPIVAGGAVVLAGTPPNASVLDLPRNGPKPRFLVTGTVARDDGGFRIELALFDGTSKAEVHRLRSIGLRKLDGNAQRIEDELLDWLATQGIERTAPKAGLLGKLLVPAKRKDSGDVAARIAPEKQDHHLLALERLREQFVIALGLASRETLLDEREVLDTYFDLCKAQPQSALASLIAAAGVMLGVQYGSTTVERYKSTLMDMTQAESDPRGPLHLLSPLFLLRFGQESAFNAARAQLGVGASESYSAWLKALKP